MLTVEQVANLLKMKPTTIRTWLKEGKLNGVKVGREWRVTKDELKSAFPHGVFEFPTSTSKPLNVDVRGNTELLKELYPEEYEKSEISSWDLFKDSILEKLERRFPCPEETYLETYTNKHQEELLKLENLLLMFQNKYGLKLDDTDEIKRTMTNLHILKCGIEIYNK